MFSNLIQTKDGASVAFSSFKCNLYARDGATSGYKYVVDKTEAIRLAINRLQVGSTEYRVEDIWDDYEEETELHFTQFTVNLYHEISQPQIKYTMFGLGEFETGAMLGDKKVYGYGMQFDSSDFVYDFLGNGDFFFEGFTDENKNVIHYTMQFSFQQDANGGAGPIGNAWEFQTGFNIGQIWDDTNNRMTYRIRVYAGFGATSFYVKDTPTAHFYYTKD